MPPPDYYSSFDCPYISILTDFRQQDIVVNLKNSFIILINRLLFLRLISQVNSCHFGSVVT